ncbi:uncharacterized protein BYT42DRAFT_561562 [Radiomyces spectabilis]|uniref:uncharacterized protein n=1 Tax=Radiomyces spectabilis TaxID=64574 RepID=UPI00221E8AB0|nr:uncharacterized protein BYT42DRAFT_561562 [Radiomyces spectabilis]KAI8388868.1 hypothetical protein BYT42DRAFT_561562 [Radiomyces spectabilis]
MIHRLPFTSEDSEMAFPSNANLPQMSRSSPNGSDQIFSHEQINYLQQKYRENPQPSDSEINDMATTVKLNEQLVRSWYLHRANFDRGQFASLEALRGSLSIPGQSADSMAKLFALLQSHQMQEAQQKTPENMAQQQEIERQLQLQLQQHLQQQLVQHQQQSQLPAAGTLEHPILIPSTTMMPSPNTLTSTAVTNPTTTTAESYDYKPTYAPAIASLPGLPIIPSSAKSSTAPEENKSESSMSDQTNSSDKASVDSQDFMSEFTEGIKSDTAYEHFQKLIMTEERIAMQIAILKTVVLTTNDEMLQRLARSTNVGHRFVAWINSGLKDWNIPLLYQITQALNHLPYDLDTLKTCKLGKAIKAMKKRATSHGKWINTKKGQ